jgi:hypothetical protein
MRLPTSLSKPLRVSVFVNDDETSDNQIGEETGIGKTPESRTGAGAGRDALWKGPVGVHRGEM